MYRWLWMGSLAAMLVGSTGCLHHNTRGGCSSGNCGGGGHAQFDGGSCQNGSCGGCNSCGNSEPVGVLSRLKGRSACNDSSTCSCGKSGVLGRMGSAVGIGKCNGGCRTGCQAGPLGWQQGGLDYSSHLQPGLLGHNAGNQLNSRPFTPGPPSAQVAYPYYSVRGPRDFLQADPPSIGR